MAIPFHLAETWMRHALELAQRGLGKVEPNPAVGAVVVDDAGNLISVGWHETFGGPHAEIHALAAAGTAARGATLFVTLEPCCHFGKTPPCSKAVISAGIRRVYIATPDPAPYVNGGGIAELREAGVDVDVGLLQFEAARLIAPFVHLTKNRRPWIHAKWAMTLDGKIATRTGHSQWITNEASRAVVHQLRGRMDAILIGIGTALADDPLLTARPAGVRTAARIVLDSKARLPLESQLVRTAREARVIAITAETAPDDRRQRLQDAGVEVLNFECGADGHPDIFGLSDELGRRKLTNVLLEGGSRVLGSYFDAGLINEVHVFIAPKLVGGHLATSVISGRGLDRIPDHSMLDHPETAFLDGDIYVHGPLKENRKIDVSSSDNLRKICERSSD